MRHNFSDSVAMAKKHASLLLWEVTYRQVFPNFHASHRIEKHGWAQDGGIDRQLILEGGKILLIEEKVRLQSYDDILLEYWSNKEAKRPGWIAKPLACDYVAYAIIPKGCCFVMPFQGLRTAWHRHRNDWVAAYPKITAQTTNTSRQGFYTTVNVAVPISVIFSALQDAMVAEFPALCVEGNRIVCHECRIEANLNLFGLCYACERSIPGIIPGEGSRRAIH